MRKPNLIKEKIKVLAELGMTNKEAVKAYLVKETKGITDEYKLDCKLDRLAHSMLVHFFDGDKQFVLTPNK